MRAVFEAVAHRNPYPSEQFAENRWNHMVLKALFVGSTLHPIQGLDERANPPLARMLCDYAHERWAAGRPVSPELWRCVGPHADAEALADLQRVLATGDASERKAAALALAACPDPRASALLGAGARARRGGCAGRPHLGQSGPGVLTTTGAAPARQAQRGRPSMMFIDPHTHMISRTTDDYEAMAAAGVVALIEPAFWIGQPRTHVGTYIDYLSAIVGWERFRAGQFGIRHYCTIGLNSKEANNEELAEGVMEILPRFALKEGVVAIGEIGYDEQTELEDKYFRLQLELAKELDLPVMIHTPHRDKKRGTTRSMDVIEEHRRRAVEGGDRPQQRGDRAGGAGPRLSGRRSRSIPSTKMGNERMVEIVRQYGAERIIVDSACDWGISEPLGVPKTARLALERGIPEEQVRLICYQNALDAYGQSGQMQRGRLAQPAADRPAHAVRGQLDPARRPRAAGRGAQGQAGDRGAGDRVAWPRRKLRRSWRTELDARKRRKVR